MHFELCFTFTSIEQVCHIVGQHYTHYKLVIVLDCLHSLQLSKFVISCCIGGQHHQIYFHFNWINLCHHFLEKVTKLLVSIEMFFQQMSTELANLDSLQLKTFAIVDNNSQLSDSKVPLPFSPFFPPPFFLIPLALSLQQALKHSTPADFWYY